MMGARVLIVDIMSEDENVKKNLGNASHFIFELNFYIGNLKLLVLILTIFKCYGGNHKSCR